MVCRCRASVPGCIHPPLSRVHGCSHILAHSGRCWCCPRLPWHCHARLGSNPQGNHSCSIVPAVPTPPIPTIQDRSSDPLCSSTPQCSALPPEEPAAHAPSSAASV